MCEGVTTPLWRCNRLLQETLQRSNRLLQEVLQAIVASGRMHVIRVYYNYSKPNTTMSYNSLLQAVQRLGVIAQVLQPHCQLPIITRVLQLWPCIVARCYIIQ
jgi:hypothetical protein